MRRSVIHVLTSRKMATVRSTAASGSGVYESRRAVDEYLLFHFGEPNLLMPYEFGPKSALNFAERVCDLACTAQSSRLRALDIGCAVGGLSYALARSFEEVVGIDFSHSFIAAANELKDKGSMPYEALKQGSIVTSHTAHVPGDVDRNRVTFQQGDACALDRRLGRFDLIVASNLLCRLPQPSRFLRDVPHFLREGTNLSFAGSVYSISKDKLFCRGRIALGFSLLLARGVHGPRQLAGWHRGARQLDRRAQHIADSRGASHFAESRGRALSHPRARAQVSVWSFGSNCLAEKLVFGVCN